MSPSSDEHLSTSPPAAADESWQRLRLLEKQLANQERELEALLRNAKYAETVAARRLNVVESELLAMREYVHFLEQRVGTGITNQDLFAQASARVAPQGSLRGQVMGYALTTAAMATRGALRALANVAGPAPASSLLAEGRAEEAMMHSVVQARVDGSDGIPLISVIIPVFNAERSNPRYLIEALESVAAQTFRNFEMIVVDDGSTDGSVEMVEQFIASHAGLAIRLVRKENGGQSSARNLGAERAAGDWLAFLDQDDIWLPERPQTVVPYLGDSADLVYTDADMIDAKGEVKRARIHTRYGAGGRQPKTSVSDCIYADVYVMPGITTVRKEMFMQIGGFDECLSGYEDDDFFVRSVQAGRIGYVPVSTLKWRFYDSNYSRGHRMVDSRLYYWRKLLCDYAQEGSHPASTRRLTLRFLREFLAQCSSQLEEGDPLAADNLKAALTLLPFVGPVDRTAFRLVRWAWSTNSHAALHARSWFLRGLESPVLGVRS